VYILFTANEIPSLIIWIINSTKPKEASCFFWLFLLLEDDDTLGILAGSFKIPHQEKS
jgi:hypothetical protein